MVVNATFVALTTGMIAISCARHSTGPDASLAATAAATSSLQNTANIPEPKGQPSPGSPAASGRQPQPQPQSPSFCGCYQVVRHDALWTIARRAYGHATWKEVGWIQAANAELITDPNHIETGWWITIPSPQDASTNVGTDVPTRAKATIDEAPTPSLPVITQQPETSMIPLIDGNTPLESAPSDQIALTEPPFASVKIFNGSEHVRVVLERATGYRLTLPRSVALQNRIPLKGNFESQIFLFESEQEKEKGWFTGQIRHINTRVKWEKKSDEVLLSFALKTLPSKPFTIVIAGNNVDGRDFTARAEAFAGKFPGPNAFGRTLLDVKRVETPYAIASAIVANPLPLFIGAGHVTVALITRTILRRSADRIEAKAEAKLQKALAENKKLLDEPATPVAAISPSTTPAGGGL